MSPILGRGKGFLSVDLTAPVAVITNPTNGGTIGGTINLQATATDVGSGVKSVQWKVDGSNYGGVQTASPFTLALDTTGMANGAHSISALVTDNMGRSSTTTISVTVFNTKLKDVAWPGRNPSEYYDPGAIVPFNTLYTDQWGGGLGDGQTFYVPQNGYYTLYFQVRQPGYGAALGFGTGWSGTGHGSAWIQTSRYGQMGRQSWGDSTDINSNNWMTINLTNVYLYSGDWIQCQAGGGATGNGVENYDARGQFTLTST